MARTAWIGGNWKCNGTQESNKTLIATLNGADFDQNKVEVCVFPTNLHIVSVKSQLDAKKYKIGTQNISKTGNGAFTGEVSVEMALDAGLKDALIGHSERRTLYHECNHTVATKVEATQKSTINAIVCIGEKLEERESNKTNDVLTEQMKAFIPKVSDWNRIVIAYEPVWAIGTGKVASKEQAQEAHKFVRDLIAKEVNADVASKVRIVYGGSVNEKNCAELSSQPDIDGFLVGGASLKPEFVKIIQSKC